MTIVSLPFGHGGTLTLAPVTDRNTDEDNIQLQCSEMHINLQSPLFMIRHSHK